MAADIREQDLLARYRKTGDTAILGQLYSDYMHLVYGVCLKYLKDRDRSQDAVMDIFESLVDKLRRQEVANFKSWLFVVARNHCLMILRSAAHKKEMSNKSVNDMEFALPAHHDNGQMNNEDMAALKNCIEKLKKEQKECVALFYLEEMSYREITEQTRFDLKKVKSHIQNGKRNIKLCIENDREKRE